jgi:hypothetical protein
MKIAILAHTKAYLRDVRVHSTAAAEMDRESAEWDADSRLFVRTLRGSISPPTTVFSIEKYCLHTMGSCVA